MTIKKICILSFILLISISISAQSLYRKKVYHKVTKYLVEEYDTQDSTTVNKLGFYARFNSKNGKMIKQGSYKDNVRTGVWSFYDDSAKINFRYNYTTGLVMFSRPDTLAKHFLIQAGIDTNFYKDLSQVPLFVGGPIEYKDFIAANLRYPNVAKEFDISGTVIASFVIGANGYPEKESRKIIKGLGYGCDDEVLRIINLMPRWVPARKSGEVRQLYYMTFKFEPTKK
jgi:hypothetical protein